MSSLRISVAMCTFNGQEFLAAQLKSIASQERLPDEVVICDDRSSDGTVELIREFAHRAPFSTRIVLNSQNLGSTKNFEKAISLCSGEIIVLSDQDDIWYAHKLKRIEKSFSRSNDVVAAFSDADLIDGDSRPIDSRLWPTLSFDPSELEQCRQGEAFKVLLKHPVVTGATMAFRKDLFDILAPIPATEIHDRWISFFLAIYGQFAVITEPLMQYRRHGSQLIGPGPLTMDASFDQARSRGAKFYFDEIARFQQIHERLREREAAFPNSQQALKEIEKKIAHLERRASLPRVKIARVSQVVAEMVNGNYWRYSGGLRSLAKDLLLQ